MRIKTSLLMVLIVLLCLPATASEGKILVAVAANYMMPFAEIVLFSGQHDFCSRFTDWTDAVQSDAVRKIAIAKPETAPYGAAAVTGLKESGLYDTLYDKYVFPQDIGQAFQYATTGSVQAGFCALSSAMTDEGRKGCCFPVKQAPPVTQAACVLKRTQNREAAKKFAAFLLTQTSVRIKEKYGYR